MNGLDLFSGIGGLTLALEPWVQPTAYCEIDRYAQAVLLSRMRDGSLPSAPIWDDVRTLMGSHLPPIDIITAGFPCQDISDAGFRVGMGGERSGLWWHVQRLIAETHPRFVFLENVPAIRTRGLNSLVQSLAELGYDCRWTIVSAGELGAPHLRKRWFLLAHTAGVRSERGMAGSREEKGGRPHTEAEGHIWWASERGIRRVVHGVPLGIHRIRSLGNSVIPLQARAAFERLIGI